MNCPKKYREIIEQFLWDYFICRKRQLEENFKIELPLSAQLPILEAPLETPLGQQLVKIAQAAAGLLPPTASFREEVGMAVESLVDSLASPPVSPQPESIPAPLGQMVIDGIFWASGDHLITFTEAAGMLDMKPDEVGKRIRRGQLTLYRDSKVSDRRSNRRVSHGEVELLAANRSNRAERRSVSPARLVEERAAGATLVSLAEKYAMTIPTIRKRIELAMNLEDELEVI